MRPRDTAGGTFRHARLERRGATGSATTSRCRHGPADHLRRAFEGRKGLDFAAEIIAKLRQRFEDATLLLVGTPEDHHLASVPGVVCSGWISDTLVDLAYGCADVTLVPSRYEAFSRVVIEGWAHSCPVVVTEGVALAPMVVRSGGAVVRYGDSAGAADDIARLMLDRRLRRKIGAAGRAFVEAGFLLDQAADQTVALYRQLADGPGGEERG